MLGTPKPTSCGRPDRTPRCHDLPTPRDGNLGEISERLAGRRTADVSLIGRCHKAPQRTLEQDYQLTTKVLGTGYSGSVRLATAKRRGANHTVAVKTFRLRGLRASQKERLQSEIEVFLSMDHPHVARLLNVYETDAQMSLVMECVEGGELFSRVTKVKRLTEQGAADATRQMLLALNYLHSHNMVHRDLKLENFLYDLQGSNHLKMIDFGFSKYIDSRGRMRTSCGTLAYVAPEVLKRSYTSQCDLWSMGVIVFILLSGQMPFHAHADSEKQIKEIKSGKYTFKDEYWKGISLDAQDFTRSLLQVDPNKRLNAKKALEHRWIASNYELIAPQVDISIMEALAAWRKAPKLQRACMSMMVWTLNNKHHAQVRDSFLALDLDHDGCLSPADLRQAMDGKVPGLEEAVQEIFGVLNGQKIHYSDFLAAMMSSYIDLDDNLIQGTFHKFDLDDSGFIDSQDLRGVLGDTFEGHEVEMLVDEADAEKSGKIDYTRFADYARAYHPGTLFKKSTACDEQEQESDEPAVHVVEVAPTVGQRGNQACCVVQ